MAVPLSFWTHWTGTAHETKGQSGSRWDADPAEWELPPKPKSMWWATYERWVARYDAAEEMLDA